MASTESDPTTTLESQEYSGNCHCGANRFTVTLTPPLQEQKVMSCNCSICSRNGYLLVYPRDKDVKWVKGSLEGLTGYAFGNQKVAHKFCPVCGTSLCIKSVDPTFFFDITCINVRALKDVDIESLQLNKTEGKKVEPLYGI